MIAIDGGARRRHRYENHCIDHIRAGEDAAAYVRRVERETDHPHFVRESD
ncbi:MAG: hypothetical protein ABSG76_06900 [Xanthobacteraceae bacterium]